MAYAVLLQWVMTTMGDDGMGVRQDGDGSEGVWLLLLWMMMGR